MPASETQVDRSGHVYVLKAHKPFEECYKIGRTNNIDKRLHTFAVKLPYKVDLVCSLYCSDMYALEDGLHRVFKDKRLDGEWFKLSESDVGWLRWAMLVEEARWVCFYLHEEMPKFHSNPNPVDEIERYLAVLVKAVRRLKRRLARMEAIEDD